MGLSYITYNIQISILSSLKLDRRTSEGLTDGRKAFPSLQKVICLGENTKWVTEFSWTYKANFRVQNFEFLWTLLVEKSSFWVNSRGHFGCIFVDTYLIVIT